MANNQKWSGKLASLQDRVEAWESVNVLRGYGKATTEEAKIIRHMIANKAVIEEMIEKHQAKAR